MNPEGVVVEPDHHASKRGLQRADREVLLEAPHAIGHDGLEHRGALVVAVERREERGVPLEVGARVGRRHRCFIGQSYGRGRERREGRRAEQRSTPRHRRRRRFGAGVVLLILSIGCRRGRARSDGPRPALIPCAGRGPRRGDAHRRHGSRERRHASRCLPTDGERDVLMTSCWKFLLGRGESEIGGSMIAAMARE